jgi:hypothetical protein
VRKRLSERVFRYYGEKHTYDDDKIEAGEGQKGQKTFNKTSKSVNKTID